MAKPETAFINWIKKECAKSPKDIYIEKTCNPYRSGTPDLYMESEISILWVEVKFVPRQPKTEVICNRKVWDLCTALQKRWIERAWKNGIPCIELIGYPEELAYISKHSDLNASTQLFSRSELLQILNIWL